MSTRDSPGDLADTVLVDFLGAYLNGVILEALTHGIYTSVVLITLWRIFIHPEIPLTRSQGLAMGLPVVFMFALTTLNLAVRWSWTSSPIMLLRRSGGTGYYAFGFRDNTVLWAISGAATGFNVLIADCILIWRCWIIWGQKWTWIALPSALTICGTVFDGFFVYHNATDKYSTDQKIWGTGVNWGILYYSTSLATTAYCTLFIIYRILRHRGGRFGSSYNGVIEILVESAALYIVALIIFLPFLAQDEPSSFYPKALLDTVTSFAPTLIVARVVSGHARSDKSWSADDGITTMQFAARPRFSMRLDSIPSSTEATLETPHQQDEDIGITERHDLSAVCKSCGAALVRRHPLQYNDT
ncbi:hypothetical protein BDZ89DRAFT_571872 [Hymenopellis radicata]|nr:hypothetical protein BDZ89DRAFT_571872 [Hymenopellis radicata]